MEWIEISVAADGEAAEAISELFNRLNGRPDGQGSAVMEVSGFDPVGEDHHPVAWVRTYLPADEPDTEERQHRIEEGLWHLARLHPLGTPQVRRLADADWENAWRATYRPLRIGRCFLVVPAWEAGTTARQPGDVPIILDPGMAFGTGLHPSTQLCLQALEDILRPGERVLDAGCGSGILSIGAARLAAGSVDAFDIDPLAVRATAQNAALNDLPVAIHAYLSAGPGEGEPWAQPAGAEAFGGRPTWDVMLVNILPHIILALLDAGLHTYLAPGGRMILAGIIAERAPEVVTTLADHDFTVVRRLEQGDWVALVAAAIERGR